MSLGQIAFLRKSRYNKIRILIDSHILANVCHRTNYKFNDSEYYGLTIVQFSILHILVADIYRKCIRVIASLFLFVKQRRNLL